VYRAEVFREDEQFVAICPELNVSSFADTVEEARKSLREAINLFIEECEAMGTLSAVLREAGFSPDSADPQKWVSRTPILVEQVTS
jgi:predicted RNase H-like HicB family nuclease